MLTQETTIIALATPMGRAPLAILRVSGLQTFEITAKLFTSSKDFRESQGHEIFFGYIKDPSTQEDIDQVLLSVFKAPRSFTGEDMVEITCHGGTILFQKILDLYLSQGASLAKRGEFSKRAFFNGKMDLTQAEAIHDLIFSRSLESAKRALSSLKKNFFHQIQSMKNEILLLVSKIEVGIDYSEEYENTWSKEDITSLEKVLAGVSKLRTQGERLREYNKGHTVAIIGAPNAGKSSLLNMIVGEEKAIVSNIAGTTRDPVEVSMVFKDTPITMIDTAGIRDKAHDDIEEKGIQKSKAIMLTADFILFLIDCHDFSLQELQNQVSELLHEHIPFALVWNKQDLIPHFKVPEVLKTYPSLFLSCENQKGLPELLDLIEKSVQKIDIGDGQVFLNQRQTALLTQIAQILEETLLLLKEGGDMELVSLLLQKALESIAEIDGSDIKNDILETIFSNFCVGK